MCREHRFSKETRRAISKFTEAWSKKEEYNFSPMISDQEGMFCTDYIGFSWNEIDLKGAKEWRWNQSISNVAFWLNAGTKVFIYKLNSRKKKGASDIPSFKTWMYRIHFNNSERPAYYGVWCEKGTELPAAFIEPSTITLADLSFLKPFINEDLAADFNW